MLITYIETIGRYGSYVYYGTWEQDKARKFAKKEFTESMRRFGNPDEFIPGQHKYGLMGRHMIGYLSAAWHYLKFGDSKLSELARLSPSDAIDYHTRIEMKTSEVLS